MAARGLKGRGRGAGAGAGPGAGPARVTGSGGAGPTVGGRGPQPEGVWWAPEAKVGGSGRASSGVAFPGRLPYLAQANRGRDGDMEPGSGEVPPTPPPRNVCDERRAAEARGPAAPPGRVDGSLGVFGIAELVAT